MLFRSEVTPHPKYLLKDGETVIKYLKKERKVEKLVIHGESLGGALASCIANKYGCDLLFANRTFGKLDSVAGTFGEAARKLFNWITNWELNCVNEYLNGSYPKVIGNDPSDGTIHELASLKTEISIKIEFPYANSIKDCYYILSKRH